MVVRRPRFPGMDPWLEGPEHWPDVHNRLVVAMGDALSALVGARYFVGVERRSYRWTEGELELIGLPDVQVVGPVSSAPPAPGAGGAAAGGSEVRVLELDMPAPLRVREAHLRILDVERRKVVTVIEVLSPSNKLHQAGRRQYLEKRQQILQSLTSLIEIDLMRAGRLLPLYRRAPASDYRVLIRRGARPGKRTLFEFSYKSPIPALPIPLGRGEPEPLLDLNRVLHDQVDRARFYSVIDYGKPPAPSLRPEDEPWAAGIIAEASRPAD